MNAAELLRSLDAGATGAPWFVAKDDNDDPAGIVVGLGSPGWVCDTDESEGKSPDAILIATTRNLLPELAALVESADEALDAIRRVVEVEEARAMDRAEADGAGRWAYERYMVASISHLQGREKMLRDAHAALNAKAGEVK